MKRCQAGWTLLCVLVGMFLKGSIDLAKKAMGEFARNSGFVLISLKSMYLCLQPYQPCPFSQMQDACGFKHKYVFSP